jgi:hypothetical protein
MEVDLYKNGVGQLFFMMKGGEPYSGWVKIGTAHLNVSIPNTVEDTAQPITPLLGGSPE